MGDDRDGVLDDTLRSLRDWLARCENATQAASVARAIVAVLNAQAGDGGVDGSLSAADIRGLRRRDG